jgi:hypothetical protein
MRWAAVVFYITGCLVIAALGAQQAEPEGFVVPVYAGPGEPLQLRVEDGQAFTDAARIFLDSVR